MCKDNTALVAIQKYIVMYNVNQSVIKPYNDNASVFTFLEIQIFFCYFTDILWSGINETFLIC